MRKFEQAGITVEINTDAVDSASRLFKTGTDTWEHLCTCREALAPAEEMQLLLDNLTSLAVQSNPPRCSEAVIHLAKSNITAVMVLFNTANTLAQQLSAQDIAHILLCHYEALAKGLHHSPIALFDAISSNIIPNTAVSIEELCTTIKQNTAFAQGPLRQIALIAQVDKAGSAAPSYASTTAALHGANGGASTPDDINAAAINDDDDDDDLGISFPISTSPAIPIAQIITRQASGWLVSSHPTPPTTTPNPTEATDSTATRSATSTSTRSSIADSATSPATTPDGCDSLATNEGAQGDDDTFSLFVLS